MGYSEISPVGLRELPASKWQAFQNSPFACVMFRRGGLVGRDSTAGLLAP